MCRKKVIILSDSTKFGKRGLGRICGLEEVDQVIPIAVYHHFVSQLESRGIELTIV
jgi:DeoR family transcriptional regulator of aga operon